MICRACGAVLEENSAVCKKCGARLAAICDDRHTQREEKRKLLLASVPVLGFLVVMLLVVTVNTVRADLSETLSIKAEDGETVSAKESCLTTQTASIAVETEEPTDTAVCSQAETDAQTVEYTFAPQTEEVYNERDVIQSILDEAGLLIETEPNGDPVTQTNSYIWTAPENTWDLDGMGN